MKHTVLALATALMLLLVTDASPNNLQISNVMKQQVDLSENLLWIKCRISWDNSWRVSSSPGNWDAAWVFVKYRIDGGNWQHATLSTSPGDFSVPSGCSIDIGSDGKGFFAYRNSEGSGSINWKGVSICWDYGADGVPDNATNIEVQVFGIEMVYVPQGRFVVGSNGGIENNHFHQGDVVTKPFAITTEDEIRLGNDNDRSLWALGEWDNPDVGTELPAVFPKGYDAFYCMKYEISQGQYADFLNTLTSTQVENRYSPISVNRYTIGGTYPDLTASSPDLACNYISWADGTAYCDWAGLRPMTELEYEKACRGAEEAVANEHAWGTAAITISPYTLEQAGTADEGIDENYSVAAGNCSFAATNDVSGPLRVGIFAAHPDNTGRVTSGATFYGIMEMSGNLFERSVTVGNATGRAFTGVNGDGELDEEGDADVTNWPDVTAVGSGFRGGDWDDPHAQKRLQLADRSFAARPGTTDWNSYGFRGVRCPEIKKSKK